MKIIPRSILLLALFVLIGASVNLPAQNIEDGILKRVKANRERLTTLRSNISVVKYDHSLQKSEISNGKLIYLFPKQRDVMFRVDWKTPNKEILSVKDGKYVIYRPNDIKVISSGKLKDNKTAFLLWLIGISEEELERDYQFKYVGEVKLGGEIPVWHLALTPNRSEDVKSVEFWIDGNGMIIQAKIVETNNNSTIFSLSNLEKNSSLNVHSFRIVPIEG